jgi:hypothetical protein
MYLQTSIFGKKIFRSHFHSNYLLCQGKYTYFEYTLVQLFLVDMLQSYHVSLCVAPGLINEVITTILKICQWKWERNIFLPKIEVCKYMYIEKE